LLGDLVVFAILGAGIGTDHTDGDYDNHSFFHWNDLLYGNDKR
jgi:hypothetical protein